MISAGETSGELYGALLSRELRKAWPDVRIFGVGGRHMQEEGVYLLAPVSHVMGIFEVTRHLFEIRRTFTKAKNALITEKPDVLVLIDYPDFNIALAKKAKAAGIPVLYYVSPQVWAWRRNRVNKIASLVNRMAVLFPFELDYYKDTGLPCEFVGHPLVETLDTYDAREHIKEKLGLDPHRDILSILPGSRPGEIKKHQRIVAGLAEKIHGEFPDMQIVIPLVPGTDITEPLPGFVRVVYGRTSEVLACSEAAAVASGTATLQTGLLGVPMVVFYRVSPFTFHLVKLITKVRFISLVNLLSGREVVKELLQKEANPGSIYSELRKILTDEQYRNKMTSALDNVKNVMCTKKPSARVAAMAGELAGWSVPGP